MQKVMTAGWIVLGLLFFVLSAFVLGSIFDSADLKEIPSDTPGVVAFRTGGGTLLGIAMGFGALVMGVAIWVFFSYSQAKVALKRLAGFRLVGAVCEQYGVTKQALAGRSRAAQVTRAREVTMYILHRYAHTEASDMSPYIGGRRLDTIRQGIDRIEQLQEADIELRVHIRNILSMPKGKSFLRLLRHALPGFLVGLLLGAPCTGIGSYWLYSSPLSEEIVVDTNGRIIDIQQKYLMRNNHRLIGFDEIAFITYQYYEGRVGTGNTPGFPASGEVHITKTDGTEIKVSEDGPSRQRDLAEALARATGKPLREE